MISGKILVDLKRSRRKSPDSAWQGPIFRPLQKGNVFQKGPKSGPSWNQKWPLLAGPFFAPSLADVLKACRPMCAKVSFRVQPASAATNLELGRPAFTSPIFLAFSGPENRPVVLAGFSPCPRK